MPGRVALATPERRPMAAVARCSCGHVEYAPIVEGEQPAIRLTCSACGLPNLTGLVHLGCATCEEKYA